MLYTPPPRHAAAAPSLFHADAAGAVLCAPLMARHASFRIASAAMPPHAGQAADAAASAALMLRLPALRPPRRYVASRRRRLQPLRRRRRDAAACHELHGRRQADTYASWHTRRRMPSFIRRYADD